MAGASTLVPSLALMPATFFWEMRSSGGAGNNPTGSDPWALWQSTQVAWRLLLRSVFSVASGVWVETGNGCPTLGVADSANTLALGVMGEMFAPLWQAIQSCSF